MNKRLVTLGEMRELQLGMMDCIHDYCTRHRLRYSLGGGTLLGAIRHKGYIPWDDDVDIMMPRPDYDKFIAGFAGKYEHCILQHTGLGNTNKMFAKVYDDRTVLEEPGETNGVYVDVFAIDGLPAWDELPRFHKRYNALHLSVTMHTYPWRKLNYKEFIYFMLHIHRLCMPAHKALRLIDEMLHSHDFDTAQVAGCITGSYGEKEFMDAEVFKNYTEVEFEGHRYSAIAAYDAYLTKHYGDYMQLPPEEKRHSHHVYRCWWK